MKRKFLVFSALSASLLGNPVMAEDLLEVYQLAVGSDPQLRQAAASRLSTAEARPQAKSALYPQISASANSTWNETGSVASFNNKGYSLSLTQAIYNHQTYANLRAADAQIAQSEATYKATEQDLIVRVATAYFDLLGAGDDLEFARAEKKAISRQLEQAQKRFEVGLIAITDVHEAQARFDLSTSQEISAINGVDSAREALAEITGQAHEQLSTLGNGMQLVSPDPQDLNEWTAQAEQTNFSLAASRSGASAAQESIAIQKADRYPTVSLVGSHGHTESNGGTSRGNRDSNSIALQVSVPLFTGGLTSANVRQAEYDYTAALESLEQTRRSVVRQTRDAYRGVEAGIAQVKALEQALVSNESAVKATKAGFDVGTRTIVDVLDAQRGLYDAIRDLKRAKYDYIVATLQLKQAAGSLNVADLDAVNGWLN
ncbi:MAG: TolC family outer membrane protein [Gammaproteobacteria bacterium]